MTTKIEQITPRINALKEEVEKAEREMAKYNRLLWKIKQENDCLDNLWFEMLPGHLETKLVHTGYQHLFRFENGLGASVIKHDGSYGNRDGEGLWEIALIKWEEEGWDFVFEPEKFQYSELGWQGLEESAQVLTWIAGLPKEYEVSTSAIYYSEDE
jgi:hypothetical protein